jgi:hypothetical protein
VTFRVTALMAAHNEEDIVGQVVRDLAGQGIGIYLLDHGSTDDTRGEVERAAGRALVGVERLDVEGFSLQAILERKAQLARELDASWFINQDADELRESPWTDANLFEGIRRVDALGYNAIDFEVLNFWPTHDDFRKGDDVRAAFPLYERGGAFDRLQIRGWKKVDGPFDLLSSGGHETAFAGRRVFPLRFLLRHYPIRGQAHGERKVFQERRPRFAASERQRGWHVQYDALQPGHRFLRDPKTLTAYDPHAVRVQLALHHRGVEDLEATLAEERREGDRLRTKLAARVAEVERLNADIAQRTQEKERLDLDRQARAREVQALNRDLEARGRDVEVLNREIEGLGTRLAATHAEMLAVREERDATAREVAVLGQERDALRQEGESLSARLAAVESSLTWRMGAPVRSAADWLRRRS